MDDNVKAKLLEHLRDGSIEAWLGGHMSGAVLKLALKRLNAYQILVETLTDARQHLSDEYGVAREMGDEIDRLLLELGEQE